jgi:hypothetical protein
LVWNDFIFLGHWRSAQDLEEYSLSPECTFKIFPDRYSKNPPKLSQISIHKACKTGKTYKGLKFEYGAPLSMET